MMEGLVGQGAEIQAADNQLSPKRFSASEGLPCELPVKAGSPESHNWLDRNFYRTKLPLSPSRPNSFPGQAKNELDVMAKVMTSARELGVGRIALVDSSSSVASDRLDDCHLDRLMAIMSEEEGRLPIETLSISKGRRSSTGGVRLKPLVLMNRQSKQRVTSFPVINATIGEEAIYQGTTRRKNSLLMMTGSSQIPSPPRVGGPPIMTNARYSNQEHGEKLIWGVSSLQELQTASASPYRLNFADWCSF